MLIQPFQSNLTPCNAGWVTHHRGDFMKITWVRGAVHFLPIQSATNRPCFLTHVLQKQWINNCGLTTAANHRMNDWNAPACKLPFRLAGWQDQSLYAGFSAGGWDLFGKKHGIRGKERQSRMRQTLEQMLLIHTGFGEVRSPHLLYALLTLALSHHSEQWQASTYILLLFLIKSASHYSRKEQAALLAYFNEQRLI